MVVWANIVLWAIIVVWATVEYRAPILIEKVVISNWIVPRQNWSIEHARSE
jgi:hypothetical protein